MTRGGFSGGIQPRHHHRRRDASYPRRCRFLVHDPWRRRLVLREPMQGRPHRHCHFQATTGCQPHMANWASCQLSGEGGCQTAQPSDRPTTRPTRKAPSREPPPLALLRPRHDPATRGSGAEVEAAELRSSFEIMGCDIALPRTAGNATSTGGATHAARLSRPSNLPDFQHIVFSDSPLPVEAPSTDHKLQRWQTG